MVLVSREKETRLLEAFCESRESEFLALYGRRRVGKTFLIRQFFKQRDDVVFFNVTGMRKGSMREQIQHFTQQMSTVFYKDAPLTPGKNWDVTLQLLTRTLKEQAPLDKKLILFFDELPWMATRNSRLLEMLDYYWNQHWSNDERIKLIICGSSSAWILDKVIHDKGGLHNRVTREMRLEPFNLTEMKQFLQHRGVQLNHKHILLLFMITGGVPFYLAKIEKGFSAMQIIEQLAFSKKAFFIEEFDKLFASLFNNSEEYVAMVKLIAKKREGINETILLKKLGKAKAGHVGKKMLNELEQSGFIMRFKPIYSKKKGVYYRLVDEYTLFYLKWIEPIKDSLEKDALDSGNWQDRQSTPEWYSWLGYAFESVCYKHLSKIRKKLNIPSTAMAGTWRYVAPRDSEEVGAQIDLLFDRKDDAITFCEIKYTDEFFTLTKEYVDVLRRKVNVFQKCTGSSKQVFIAMVAANGLKKNYYAEEFISGVVTLEDLFTS